MKVSIIVPIYNVGSYVFQCVTSLINQTYSNIEIILVIDGATDDSALTCHGLAKNDSRIKIVEQNNGGLVSARKKGLDLATGEFILNVDGDDWIDSNCVELLVDQVLKYDVDVVIAGYYREFVGNLEVITPNFSQRVYKKEEYANSLYPELISSQTFFKHGISTFSWGKLFRKSLIDDFQFAVPNQITIGEDTVVTYPTIVASNSISIIHDPIYFYRQRAQSMLKMSEKPFKELINIRFMVNFLEKQLQECSNYNFSHQIRDYIVALSVIRTGACLDHDSFIEGVFREQIKNKKIVLYSSGSFGQQIFSHLKKNQYNLAGWVDEDTFESNAYGLPVISIDEIKEIQPDIIIIATLDQKVFMEISLKINSIVGKKITCIYPTLEKDLIDNTAKHILGS